jgi:hypothetical protein
LVLYDGEPRFCPSLCNISAPSGTIRKSADLRPFNSRVWVGSEVFGKDYDKGARGEKLRDNAEQMLLGKSSYGLHPG